MLDTTYHLNKGDIFLTVRYVSSKGLIPICFRPVILTISKGGITNNLKL